MQTAILRKACYACSLRIYARGLHSVPSENIAGDTHLASQNNYGKLEQVLYGQLARLSFRTARVWFRDYIRPPVAIDGGVVMQTTYIRVRVCMLCIPRRPIPTQSYACTLACAYKNAGVPISRCLSTTEEPGERHDWRIGAGMPSPVAYSSRACSWNFFGDIAWGSLFSCEGPYFTGRIGTRGPNLMGSPKFYDTGRPMT